MSALFSTPDIPKPPPQPMAPAGKPIETAASNAAEAERQRRLRAMGRQKSTFAGDLPMAPKLLTSKLGGGA